LATGGWPKQSLAMRQMSRGKGRKRQNPIQAGAKYSVTLPPDMPEDYLELIKSMEQEKGSLNAALLYFLFRGIEAYQNKSSQIMLPVGSLPEKQQKAITQWLQSPVSQKALKQLLLFLTGTTTKTDLEDPQKKEGLTNNTWAKKLMSTGFE